MLFPVAVIIVMFAAEWVAHLHRIQTGKRNGRARSHSFTNELKHSESRTATELFRVMTKDAAKLKSKAARTGFDWVPYEFKWKPGDVKRAPGWCAPHQPRLDWQMWFAALGSPREKLWFYNLEICFARRQNGCDATLCAQSFSGKTTAIHPGRFLSIQIYNHRRTSRNGRVVETTRTRRILADDLARAILIRSMITARRLRDASSVSNFGDAERGADRNGRNGDASVARHDVSRRSSRPAQCPSPIFPQDAQHFIRIVPGDKVSVELSPYDLTKARIIFSRAVAHR